MPKPENVIKHKWKKGQSGNPKGRPKLPDIRELLAKVLGDEKDGKSAAEAILAALRAKAARGDVRAAELLLDRAYGKPKMDIEMAGSMTTVILPKPVNFKKDGGEEESDSAD